MENKQYSQTNITASNLWLEKKCYFCGKNFEEGDKIVLLVPWYELKTEYKSLSRNVVMHEEEFNDVLAEHGDDTIIYLAKRKTPRVKPVLTDKQTKNINAFTRACYDLEFKIPTAPKSPTGKYKFRKNRTSLQFVYSPLSNHLELNRKGRRGLFDGLFERQLVDKLRNKMYEYLGLEKIEEFSANKCISEAIEKANDMLN